MADPVKFKVAEGVQLVRISTDLRNPKSIPKMEIETKDPKSGLAVMEDSKKRGDSYEFSVSAKRSVIDVAGLERGGSVTLNMDKGAATRVDNMRFGPIALKATGGGRVLAEVTPMTIPVWGTEVTKGNQKSLPKSFVRLLARESFLAPTVNWNKNDFEVKLISNVRLRKGGTDKYPLVMEQKVGKEFKPLIMVGEGQKIEFVDKLSKPIFTLDENKPFADNVKAFEKFQDEHLKQLDKELQKQNPFLFVSKVIIEKLPPAPEPKQKAPAVKPGKKVSYLDTQEAQSLLATGILLTEDTPMGSMIQAVADGTKENTGGPTAPSKMPRVKL